MSKTIFDILKKDIDLKKEIDKLNKLFSVKKIVKVQADYGDEIIEITYSELCDKYLYLWEFRNT